METTLYSPVAEPLAYEITTRAGRTFVLRRIEPSDVPDLARFGTSPAEQDLCLGAVMRKEGEGCGRCAERGMKGGPALIATLPDGTIVAATWLDPRAGDPKTGWIALVVPGAYQGVGLEVALLAALADEAKALGYRRLGACVPQGRHDALADFREAGLHVASSLGIGGITEVVLTLD